MQTPHKTTSFRFAASILVAGLTSASLMGCDTDASGAPDDDSPFTLDAEGTPDQQELDESSEFVLDHQDSRDAMARLAGRPRNGSDILCEEVPEDPSKIECRPANSAQANGCQPLVRLDATAMQERSERIFNVMGGSGAGVADFVWRISKMACSVLYKDPSDAYPLDYVEIKFSDEYPNPAWVFRRKNHAELSFNPASINPIDPRRLKLEVFGVGVHEAVHLYQYDDAEPYTDAHGNTRYTSMPFWIQEGVADYVRIKTGYHSRDDSLHAGGSFKDAYTYAGWFLIWLDEQYEDFTQRFNLILQDHDGDPWGPGDQKFSDFAGRDVTDLWAEYQAGFSNTRCWYRRNPQTGEFGSTCEDLNGGDDQTLYCNMFQFDRCGENKSKFGEFVQGFCVQRPAADTCETTHNPVCGCDGQTYRNACLARAAGFAVRAKGPCR